MNRCILAWMDDFVVSSKLANLSTSHSYMLKFISKIDDIICVSSPSIIIIDIGNISENKLKNIKKVKNIKGIALLGYCHVIDSSVKKYFKDLGFDLVLNRNDLIKNVESLIKNIFLAC